MIKLLPRTILEVFESLPEGTLAQLINNHIAISPAPNSRHQRESRNIFPQLQKSIFSLLSFLVFSTILSAQTQNINYNFKHVTSQTGLAQNIVYHFLHDSRGYIWMGTRNGLTQYDGSRTINFLHDEQQKNSIANNLITRIIEDPLQQIWIGTDAGISKYNRSNNSFSNFALKMPDGRKEISFSVPLGFISKHELLFIETKTKSIRVFNTLTQIADSVTGTPAVDGVLRYDSSSGNHHIWTYLSSGTIHYTFRNKHLIKTESFFKGDNKNNEPVLQVVHVLPQNDSLVWLSTTEGLIELNPLNRQYIIHKFGIGQRVNELRYAAIAPDGMLWAATGNSGVFTFDVHTKKYISHFKNYGLDPFSICSNNIVSLYFDSVGNVWLGSYGKGISYTSIDKNYFQKSLPRNEFEKWKGNNNVRWIGSDNSNNLWCIMNDDAGLWKLDKEKHIIEHKEPTLENGKKFTGRFYKLLFDGSHHAWAVGKEGLFQYDLIANRLSKMNYKFFSHDLFGSNWVQAIIRFRDSSFLFCTFSGLYRITKANNDYNIEAFSELNNQPFISFGAMHQDEKGNIYIKDMANRFYTLEGPKETSNNFVIRSFPFLPQVNQFYNDSATNTVLLATNFGLYSYNRSNHSLNKKEFKTRPPFLSISSLLKRGSKLWLFGDKGLFCFDEKNNTARTFTVEDGLPSNEFNLSAIVIKENQCMAGTTNGLVSFYPDELQDKVHPPLPQLTNIYVNDSATGFTANVQEADKISLSHFQNTFSFEFAPISFQNANECIFEYKLQGYDADWIRSNNARYTRYSKIPPGNYVFQLRAIDANGAISPHSKTLQIEIAKAFWQTWLFKIVLLLLALTAIGFIIKWYLNKKIRKHKREFEKQQAVEKERTRIASDMHDDLGAGLSTLRFLSEKVKRNSFSEATKNDAEKIASNSNELMQKMNEIIWAMNEKNDTLQDLIFYTRNYAVEYCEENNLSCHAHLPEIIPELFVSGEIRRNVFLTVKESLHNVVKHAGAKEIVLHFSIDKNLTVSVKDDGIGFSNNSHNGNGLDNMKKRIESIGGSFTFLNEQGVIVEMKVPLNNF